MQAQVSSRGFTRPGLLSAPSKKYKPVDRLDYTRQGFQHTAAPNTQAAAVQHYTVAEEGKSLASIRPVTSQQLQCILSLSPLTQVIASSHLGWHARTAAPMEGSLYFRNAVWAK